MNEIQFKNRVEEHVRDAYGRLTTHFPSFCNCHTCRADVLVYALNRLPAKYVASTEGHVVTELNLDTDQMRATIDVTMIEGLRKVASAPRCGRVKPQLL